MPLKAFCQELGRNVLWNEFDNIPIDKNYSCPHCKVIMIPVNGKNKIHHFHHKIECPYQTEPETEEHLQMKAFFKESLEKSNFIKFIDLEYRIGRSIADVYCETSTSQKIAIECQCSSISLESLHERTKKYSDNDIFVLWILKMPRYMEPNDEYFTKIIELNLHKIYFGRIYYFDCESNNVYSIHFNSIRKYVEPNDFGGGYWHWLKRTKLPNFHRIANLNLLLVENNGYKIARFYDKKFW